MIRRILVSLGIMTLLIPVSTAGAIDVFKDCTGSNANTAVCKAGKGEQDAGKGLIKNIINTLMLLLGAICTIMIVIGGLRYTTSNGDSNQVASAKNTILYAVIGLVVAILASLIVGFIIDQFA